MDDKTTLTLAPNDAGPIPDPRQLENTRCTCLGGSTHGTDDPAVRRCDMCGEIVPTDPATGEYTADTDMQREACAETVARIVLSAALVRVREGVL